MDATPLASATEQTHRTKGLLRLTMACNERCPFCNVPVEDYTQKTPPPAEIERQLQQFFDNDAGTLTISGGEPTLLRNRLLDLLRRLLATEGMQKPKQDPCFQATFAMPSPSKGHSSCIVCCQAGRRSKTETKRGVKGGTQSIAVGKMVP